MWRFSLVWRVCVCLSACWSVVFCAETCLHSSSCERLAALLPLFFTLLLYFFLFFSPFSRFFVLVRMDCTESHSQAAHSSCHDGNWQGVHSEKRRERRIEAKINRDWVGCDCLVLICRQSKWQIYVCVWVCVCVMRKWMHGHANTDMAAGNYWWLGKGKIQNVLLELGWRRFKFEFCLLAHIVPNLCETLFLWKTKGILKNNGHMFLSIIKVNED